MASAISTMDAGRSSLIAVAAVLTLVKLWLVGGQTLQALGTYAYDDLLFLNLAKSIMSGNWLGPYSEATLVKGPFYSLWVAAVSSAGIPLQLAQHMLYIAACLTMVVALRPIVTGRPLLFLYAILLFNPMSYTDDGATRVLRDGIYPALTMLLVASAVGFLARIQEGTKQQFVWLILLGLVAAMFSLTREEGIWMAPFVILVMGYAAIQMFLTRPLPWRRLLLLSVPLMIWFVAVNGVAAMNAIHYGIFRTVDVKAPGFLAAYGALTRIKHSEFRPTIPVPEEVREKIYEVSPAFSELRPILEGEEGAGWKGRGWSHEGRFSHWDWGDEGFDMHGGIFMWALRGAVALKDYYASAQAAEGYYRRLADEVNSACENGKLDCGPERATLMPVWQKAYNKPLFYTFLRAFDFTISFEGFKPEPFLSRGPRGVLQQFSDITYEELFLASKGQLNLRGWAFSPGEKVSVSVSQPNGRVVPAVVRYGHSPHVYQRFLDRGLNIPEAREARFELTTPCLSGCSLDVHTQGRLIGRLPLDAGIGSTYTSELYFSIDFVDLGETGSSPLFTSTMEARLDALNAIGWVYQLLTPWLFALALFCYIVYTIRQLLSRRPTMLWIVTTALIGSVVARVLMVSMIDLISFPAIRTVYLASAYPLMLIFVCIMLAQARRVLIKP